MPLIICLMAEQIPVCPGVIELFVADIRPLAYGQGDGTVGELRTDPGNNIAEPLIGKPSVLSALKDKGAETQIIALFTAGEDIFFR